MKFAERLKEARVYKNYTVKMLSRLLFVSQRTVNYWESGERECSFEMLLKLSDVLEVSVDYLLGNDKYGGY